ncbi:uridine kinase [Apibacter adventoris]|uniref:Uridine kinase n=1 Tax=Apibacter adventoris TaxID=1679466 RepID=A0A2S8AEC1_9FLAO|nr:uridine kinase [Apibacter adventoris]PQL93456.1 uridine kinase [Apibacter adventoris]
MLTIGIAGGTGSGKTTVVNNILKQLDSNQVNVLTQDNYYHYNPNLSFDERVKLNYDHPRSIDFDLLLKHVQQLKSGLPINEPLYSFITHSRTEDVTMIQPKEILIVEGILVLADTELRKEFDVKVFVNADSDERLIRRIRRDIQERGRDLEEVIERYQTTLKPMHEEFIQPSMAFADIIIPTMKKNTVAIDVLSSVIKNTLKVTHN